MGRNSFIERSASAVLAFLKDSVLSEEYASRKGFLQTLDPRVKAVTLAGLVVCVMFLRAPGPVLAAYLVCLALAAASKIPLRLFLARTLVFPLFSLVIVLPSIFGVFTPGETLAAFSVSGVQLTVTRQGAEGALLFILRVLVSVSLAVLLTLTTRSSDLFAALRCLGVPQVFVMTLNMCHRYMFLFAGIVQDMFLAIKSRTGGKLAYHKGQRIVAWNIAALWRRSSRMNVEVYNAMVSRGYTGEPRHAGCFRVRARDRVWLCAWLVLCGVLLWR